MALLGNLGKRLKTARMARAGIGQGRPGETLIVPRFTTMPVGPQLPGTTPYIPYQKPGQAQKEIYIVESEIIKPKKEEEKAPAQVNVNITAGGGEGEASIEEEIAKKIRESPFKLRFKTLNIQEVQKGMAAGKEERDIRKQFALGYIPEKKESETITLLRGVNRVIPLITLTQGVEKKVVSYAHIYWNEETQAVIYKVIEPKLTDEENELLDELKNILKEKLDVDFKKYAARRLTII